MALTQVSTNGIKDATIATADIADDAVTLAKMAGGTDGQIITYDASGNPTAVGPGSDGQVLTSTGAGSPPAFEDVPAGGATINNATANELVTVASTTTQLDAEANLTFDGSDLTVVGEVQIGNTSNHTKELRFADSTRVDASSIKVDNSSNADLLITNDRATGSIRLATNSADKLRIDPSGRIGVGKTPAEYHSNNKGVITGDSGYAIFGRGSDTLIISQNHYYDGSDVGKYVADGEGTFYRQANGVHEFWTAGSGSADAGISLAEKVRIQNGGGISFNGDTAAANALDDYEEGTFSPILRTNGSTTGQATGTGTYVKIGRLVHAHVHFGNKTLTSLPSGDLVVVSMPFAANHSSGDEFGVSTKMVVMGVDSNSTHGYFRTNNSASTLYGYYNQDGSVWAQWSTTQWDNSGVYLIFNITYFTNS